MWSKFRKQIATFLTVFSLVNLFFIPEWANLFGEHSSHQFFLTPTPFENAYFALGSTVFAMAFLLYIVVAGVEIFRLQKTLTLIYCVIVGSLLIPLNFAREALNLFILFPNLSWASHWIYSSILIPYKIPLMIGLLFLLFQLSKKKSRKIISYTRILGLILVPVIYITYSNLFVQHKNNLKFVESRKTTPALNVAPSSKAKVLWIIFDEMDYRLVFEKRPLNLKLPQLDRFKSESIFSEKAYSPSDYTLQSIPSLLSGSRVDVTAVDPTDLTLKYPNKNLETKWSEAPNVFQQAKEMGYSTALIGWYHNYCQVVKRDLDYCRRLPAGRFGYAQNFRESVKAILERALIFDRRLERAFVFNLQQIHNTVLEQLKTRKYDLTFLHYSVPHKPYIYNRESRQLSAQVSRAPENYFGNLEEVDKILGDIRQVLESNGEWNRSIVIVTTDHSWRQSEEYDGKRDFRIPFMIKMPDSIEGKITKPISTLVTKDFILDIIANKIGTTSEAISWLEKHNRNFPKGTVLIPIEDEKSDSSVGTIPHSKPKKS